MANKSYSLAHTTWMCKYRIVFIPKYRRKAIYGQYRTDLQEIIRILCKYKVEKQKKFLIIIVDNSQESRHKIR